MKTVKTIAMALLVVALAGCVKEETVSNIRNSQLRIFGEGFSGNSKVAFDPTNPGSGAHWVLGETIDVNGTPYEIKISNNGTDTVIRDDDDGFNVDLTALYPGDDFGGNDVEVTNTEAKREIKLNTLEISYDGQGRQKMAFPMVATAEAGATNLYFRHLTAGFKMTLHNGSGSDKTVAKLKICAQSNETGAALGRDGVTVSWAQQGEPNVPGGGVGANSGDYSVLYESVMNFVLTNNNTIEDGDDLTFCVPITIDRVNRLVVKGYDSSDNELFNVIKTFTGENGVAVERNKMYVIPTINF